MNSTRIYYNKTHDLAEGVHILSIKVVKCDCGNYIEDDEPYCDSCVSFDYEEAFYTDKMLDDLIIDGDYDFDENEIEGVSIKRVN